MSDYLQYGFRMKESGDPQCLICLKVFTVSPKSPSKMKLHFERIHPESQNLPVEVFETKLREPEFLEGKDREMLGSESTVEDSEDLRLRRKLCCSTSYCPGRRITELGIDMRGQLKNELNSSEIFAIQVDGSTDVSNVEQLLGFVPFIGKEDIKERMLFCKTLSSVGASSMTGKNVGFVKYFKEIAPNSSWYHCIIHKYALAVKSVPALLKEVMDDSVKVVNLIKSSSLNSRLLSVFCEELGAEFSQLLYHTEKCILHVILKRSIEVIYFAIFASLKTLWGGVCQNSVESFLMKVEYWIMQIDSNLYDAVPLPSESLKYGAIDAHTKSSIIEHLNGLKNNIRDYFPQKASTKMHGY
ncbi:protein FAM200B-like [Belonocnema kinseyi]|uniref:protein FAM200B-like n=1 Tax=Belonocnema kinseyi TaxID=2817044 RepID=UPI00143D75F9|nr:protein FAM200B-like [Belonocnema kinseyi]